MEEVKKQGMESLFCPYEQALALKELGFDEKCIGIYYNNGKKFLISETLMTNSELDSYNSPDSEMSTPLYQQAFRWFREKQGLIYSIGHIGHTNTWVYEIINMRIAGPDYGYGETYEETELACLRKLIEIVKK